MLFVWSHYNTGFESDIFRPEISAITSYRSCLYHRGALSCKNLLSAHSAAWV